MSRNIYNIRLHNNVELVSEVVSLDELLEMSPESAEIFTEDDVILAHPIMIHSNTYYDSENGVSGIDNIYAPFLSHAKHGCVAIPSDSVLVIDDIHDDMIDQYVETVIALYGHLYDDTEELNMPTISTNTIH